MSQETDDSNMRTCCNTGPAELHENHCLKPGALKRDQSWNPPTSWPQAKEPVRNGTVSEVIDARVAIYGDPTQTFGRIAEVWSGILGTHVNAVDVPLCLMGMKLVRTQVTPDYSDNSDDIEGYLDIFRQLVGEDMIHARLTSEYLEKKAER